MKNKFKEYLRNRSKFSSEEVAIMFEKQHSYVWNAIEQTKFSKQFFRDNYTVVVTTKEDKRYTSVLMSSLGMTMLVAGFNGVFAAKLKEKYFKELGLDKLKREDFDSAFYSRKVREKEFQKQKVRPVNKALDSSESSALSCRSTPLKTGLNKQQLKGASQSPFKVQQTTNPEAGMKENKEIEIRIKKNEKGELYTTSLNVAHIFGKKHNHVLRDIENLECSEEFRESNFGLSYYYNKLSSNSEQKCKKYRITRNGIVMLAIGFTGKKAMRFKERYIVEFDRMAKEIVRLQIELAQPRDLPKLEWMKLAVKAEEEKQEVQKQLVFANTQIKNDKPKREFFDKVREAKGLYSVGEGAKILGEGRNRFFELMRDSKIFMGKTPYQRYIDRGYFLVKLTTSKKHIQSQTFITHKGLIWLQKKTFKG